MSEARRGKLPNVPAENVSWPTDPRSAARREAQGLVAGIILSPDNLKSGQLIRVKILDASSSRICFQLAPEIDSFNFLKNKLKIRIQ